ncbi:DotA/TraY family protein [Chromohalobacter israelensis]|uniref:DotA/TraY family protein n=1 Tax=Chromohalobacter israelensis TaxID=141390 RepID=UPI0006892A93|nr:DotA/TraY family protein [Chromohalobacter israelensis]MDF9435899.1 DotA/TraY family protein [Chromohalobacter israelensis]
MAAKRLMTALILAALGCLSSSGALAQAQGPVQINEIQQAAERPGDRSRDALEIVFGDIIRNPLAVDGGESTTMVASVFTVLNGIGLIVGVIVLGFIVLRKIFQAGNDGELFKRGGNNSFAVLRYLWGFIALVPTASGWSMAQLVMLWSASLIGVGTANLATDAALENFYDGGSMALEPARPETRSLAESLFHANLCAAGINRGIQEAQASGANLSNESLIQTHTLDNGFILADASRSKVCGGATYPEDRTFTSYLGIDLDQQPVVEAQMSALQQMQGYLAPEVEAYANAVFSDSESVPSASRIIATAARRYDKALGSMRPFADNKANEIREQVVNAISERGWWEMGGWYNSMAQANSVASSSFMNRAQAVGQDLRQSGAIESYHTQLVVYAENQRDKVAPRTGSTSNISEGDATNSSTGDSSKILSEVFSFLSSPGQWLTNTGVDQAEEVNGTVNPLIAMKSLGDNILVGTEGAVVGYIGLQATAGGAEGWSNSVWGRLTSFATGGATRFAVEFAKAASDALSPLIILGIIMLFGFGITLSIYVPFIPFVIWFAAIINWLVFVAIGIVAAPLWAFAHLSSEENEGRAVHGYIFMLNAMLRPVLMVAAFLMAGGILVAGGTLLNEMFGPALSNVQADSMTGVVSIIGFLGIYISVCMTLIHTSFNMIFQIPDKVMEWIGGSQLATGQGSEQEQQNAMRALATIARDGRYGRGPNPDPTTPPGGGGGKNSIQKQ